MVADALTKPVSKVKLEEFCEAVGLLGYRKNEIEAVKDSDKEGEEVSGA
jgi:hypothetical protein